MDPALKDFIKKYGGYADYTNEAHLKYEQQSGLSILERDSNGDFTVLDNGVYKVQSQYLTGSNSHPIDAFRHGYVAAVVTRDFSAAVSHGFGDLVEMFSNTTNPNELNKDYYNNSYGRSYGQVGVSNDVIAELIYYDGITQGGLIIDPNLSSNPTYSSGSFTDNYTASSATNSFLIQGINNASVILAETYNNISATLNQTVEKVGEIYATAQNHVSPLSFDLDGDGIETTHIYNDTEVYFDIDGDGFKERVGWIAADDGMLAIDTNGNGRIDDITELFGDDIMPAYDKLALYDSNSDGVINAQDAEFGNLLLWRDLNQNGVSETGELQTLQQAGIQEISLNETPLDQYHNENYISGQSSFTFSNGNTGTMYDVHFLNDNVNTWFDSAKAEQFNSAYTIDPMALILPLSRGYGSLPSLHIAMTDNSDLLRMIQDLVILDSQDFDQISNLVDDFLYEWAGVIDNDPEARATAVANNIDSRKIDFIEKFTDVPWQQLGVSDFVGVEASLGAKKIWSQIHTMMMTRILVQGTLSDSIFEKATYDFVSDKLVLNDTMSNIVSKSTAYIQDNTTDARDFWISISNILIEHKDELNVTEVNIYNAIDTAFGQELFLSQISVSPVNGTLYSALDGQPEVLSLNTFAGTGAANTIIGANGATDYILGLAGNDTIYGRGGDDFIQGNDGNDYIYGEEGNDRLAGFNGVDYLYGGSDRDFLLGGNQNDFLYGEDGNDKLTGGAGADALDGGAGEDEIDYVGSFVGVYVNLKTGIANFGDAAGDTFVNIENIAGSDEGDTLIGDDFDNKINGERGDDVIYGGAGNDLLFGAPGEDQIYGEDGDDVISGFEGAELINGGNGIDQIFYGHDFNLEGVYVDLNQGLGFSGAAQGDQYISIENIVGSNYDDTLIGDMNNNQIEGGLGDDNINGGAGDDIFISGSGNDNIDGGVGVDSISYFNLSNLGGLSINLETGFVSNGDTLANIENITGTYNDDTVIGNSSDNIISLQQGNNIANAGVGNDTIYAGDGDDVIFGGAGNDYFFTGNGNDILTGGEGIDNFVVTPHEENITLTITDFNQTEDLLNFGFFTPDITQATDIKIQISSLGSLITVDGRHNVFLENTALDPSMNSPFLVPQNTTISQILFVGNTGNLNDTIYGSNGNDGSLRGNNNDNLIFSFAGNDDSRGRSGNDIIFGNAGDDRLEGDDDNDILYGGDGEDTLRGDDGKDILYGGADDDELRGGTENDELYGGLGDDYLIGGINSSDIFASNDILDGGEGNDQMRGYLGNDIYVFEYGLDYAYDTLGFDVIEFGASINPEDISFKDHATDRSDLIIEVNNGVDELTVENQKSSNSNHYIEQLHFSDGFYCDFTRYNDWRFGTAAGERLDGRRNVSDILIHGDGDDISYGKTGDDHMHGGWGDDYLNGDEGDDVIFGGEGDDNLRGRADNDYIVGGIGDDILYGDFNSADSFAGHDVMDGGLGNDTLRGGLGDDIYIVSQGFDYYYDRGGNDVIVFDDYKIEDLSFVEHPADSNDLIISMSNGSNQIHIENQTIGSTTFHIETLQFRDGATARFNNYDDWIYGSSIDDNLVGSNVRDDTIIGYDGDDSLYGKNGNDELYGGLGDDYLRGDAGNDLLHGGAGNDELRGYDGNDTLFAGAGIDTLRGYSGADHFVLSGEESFDGNLNRITDFDSAENDTISLINGLIDYDPLTDTIEDFVTFTESSSHTYINVDRDGNNSKYESYQAVRIDNTAGEWADINDAISKGDLAIL